MEIVETNTVIFLKYSDFSGSITQLNLEFYEIVTDTSEFVMLAPITETAHVVDDPLRRYRH